MARFFGFEIKRASDNVQQTPSFVPNNQDDGALAIAPGGAYGTYVDLDGSVRGEAQLIARYREMAQHPEVDNAIDDIVNEAIVQEADERPVTLNLDDTKFTPKMREIIRYEFDEILSMLRFNTFGYDIFRRWYIDGRLYYFIVIDPQNPLAGIQDLRYVDPRKMRKIRESKQGKMSKDIPMQVMQYEKEYFIYNPKGFGRAQGTATTTNTGSSPDTEGMKIAKDSIVYVTSGVLDKNHTTIVSHLHKAIKPLNQLRALEDAVVIYRISRAPERRIFYIDVGNLPKMKAEQYLSDIMTKFKNKLVYDASTGEVRDDRKFMTMLEDFWLPRREGGRGTEISTLPAGQNLGEMEDVKYFLRKLYKSLNVPEGRLESEQTFSIGRGTEITRDEIKFAKFINRLRARFSDLFIFALEKQLILKNLITVDEWEANYHNIRVDYKQDNYYSELKEADIMSQRLSTLEGLQPWMGKNGFFSRAWIQQNVLKMTSDEIEEMESELAADQQREIEGYVEQQILYGQANQKLAEMGILPPPEDPNADASNK